MAVEYAGGHAHGAGVAYHAHDLLLFVQPAYEIQYALVSAELVRRPTTRDNDSVESIRVDFTRGLLDLGCQPPGFAVYTFPRLDPDDGQHRAFFLEPHIRDPELEVLEAFIHKVGDAFSLEHFQTPLC
jgi:hypothetical protein